jgi:hypothetical protein
MHIPKGMKELVTALSKIDLDVAAVSLRSDGVVEMRVNNNANIAVEDAPWKRSVTVKKYDGNKYTIRGHLC